MVGKHQICPFSITMWPQFGQHGQKSNHSCKLVQLEHRQRYEVNWGISIPDNVHKPPNGAIFWPPEGWNLANMAKNWILLKTQLTTWYTPHTFTERIEWSAFQIMVRNHQLLLIYMSFLPPENPNLANLAKNEIISDVNWINTIAADDLAVAPYITRSSAIVVVWGIWAKTY